MKFFEILHHFLKFFLSKSKFLCVSKRRDCCKALLWEGTCPLTCTLKKIFVLSEAFRSNRFVPFERVPNFYNKFGLIFVVNRFYNSCCKKIFTTIYNILQQKTRDLQRKNKGFTTNSLESTLKGQVPSHRSALQQSLRFDTHKNLNFERKISKNDAKFQKISSWRLSKFKFFCALTRRDCCSSCMRGHLSFKKFLFVWEFKLPNGTSNFFDSV